MAQQVRALLPLLEDSGSISRTHIVTKNHPQFYFGGIHAFF